MYKKEVSSKDLEELFKAFSALETKSEYKNFFEDLCTIEEIKSLAQRWSVARLLFENSKYTDIQESTGASSATVSRVKKCLDYGKGYIAVLKKLDKK